MSSENCVTLVTNTCLLFEFKIGIEYQANGKNWKITWQAKQNKTKQIVIKTKLQTEKTKQKFANEPTKERKEEFAFSLSLSLS